MLEHSNIFRKLRFFCLPGLNFGFTSQIAAYDAMCRFEFFGLVRAIMCLLFMYALACQKRQKSQPLVKATVGFHNHHSIIMSTGSAEIESNRIKVHHILSVVSFGWLVL